MLRNEKGFTLLEVMIAVVILAVAVVPLFNVIHTNTIQVVSSDDRATANSLVRELAEGFHRDFAAISADSSLVAEYSERIKTDYGFDLYLTVDEPNTNLRFARITVKKQGRTLATLESYYYRGDQS